MADIITRLLLKTDDFDANLNRSKQSVNNFQGGISDMAKTAGASVAKFAGALGLAVGAGESMMKTINSTQTTGDAFTKMMDQSKASVDAFFTSIAMGDFTGFLSNLRNVIGKSGELSVLLDELATKSLFSNAELNNLMTSKKIQENIARNKTKSDEERNAALLKARQIQLDINKLQKGLAGTNKQSSYAMLDAAIAKQGFKGNVARETWDYALMESKRPILTNYANEYRERISKVGNAKEFNPYTGDLMATKESAQLKRQLDAWLKTSDGRFAEFSYYFTEMDDSLTSDLGKAIEMNNTANSMKGAISDATLLLDNTDAKINGSYEKQNGGNGKKEAKPLAGSLAYFDAEIAKSNASLIKSTDAQARAAIQATINELEKQKIELLVTERNGSLEALSLQISALKTKFASATTDDARKEIYKLITELESKQIHVNLTARFDEGKKPLKQVGLPTKGLDTKGMKLTKFKSPISKKDIKLNEEYNESLFAMSSLMGSLSGAFNENSGSILQWGASLLGTIAQAIPAIAGMIPIKMADTVATNANTTAEVTNAGAKAMSAHAGIPFAGIAIGLAGVASIIAVMASMPKFATGGIVPGSSFSGDSIMARVNSGEMILNSGQQSNLFRLANGQMSPKRPIVGNISNLIMPSGETNKVEVFGRLVAKGTDLETVITNRVRKTGKKLW